jgi:hypothetical protein
MRRTAIAGSVAMALLALAAAPAAARDVSKEGMTAKELAAWFTKAGFPADVQPDPTTPGDQLVSTTMETVDVNVYLYGCAGGGDARRCTSIQYAVGWPTNGKITVDQANAWNVGHRYIKAYINTKGQIWGMYDLDIAPGGAAAMMDDTLQNWRTALPEFIKAFTP